MKKILIAVGAILLAGAIAAGSFWGGMAYQTNQANQARANFLNTRGLTDGGQLPANGGGVPAGGFPGGGAPNGQNPGFPGGGAPNGQNPGFIGGGGTIGQVKTIDGNVMTISTAQNVTSVNLTDTTQVEKTVSGAISDLQPGMQVMVTGKKDASGNITASQVSILNINPIDRNNPSATGTAP